MKLDLKLYSKSIPDMNRKYLKNKNFRREIKYLHYFGDRASLVAQLVKNPPAMWETWIRSLSWEDLLERGKATHSVFWPGEFHGLYSPWGCKESDMTE